MYISIHLYTGKLGPTLAICRCPTNDYEKVRYYTPTQKQIDSISMYVFHNNFTVRPSVAKNTIGFFAEKRIS
jgi:hypothetical protein